MLAESDLVEDFVSASVVTSKIHGLTGDELLTAYEKYCQTQNWALVSVQAFRTKVKQLMLENFDLKQSHDIVRYDPPGCAEDFVMR